jgi:hypothetical protein
MKGTLSRRERANRGRKPVRAFHGQVEGLEDRRLLSFPPPAVVGPGVNPADFRVTEFATGLNFPTGLLTMADGSLLASINVPNDPSNPNFYNTTGEVVRFTDSTGTGVADNAGTVLYNSLPGPITDLQQAGPYIIVTTTTGQITFLHTGATPTSPLTLSGSIQLAFPSVWEHETYGLAVRPTPGVSGSYDVLFNVGSQYNGIEEDSSGNIIYGSNGIAVPEPTTGTVPATGLITGTLNGDSIYMVHMTDNNGTPVLSDLRQVATGLRNAASLVFDPAGDLYLADNGIDGTDGGYYGFSTDTLQMISAADVGVTDPNFGFPYSYTLTNQTPGSPVTAVNPTERVTPLASFEPLADPNLPGTGSRSQGASGAALSPPMFPAGLNNGLFVGFHGVFDSGGTSNDKNPMLFVNPGTGSYFDFISNDEPNIGHLDGAASTENALFVSDIASNGQLWGSPSPGVIYEIEAINHAPVVVPIATQTVTAGQTVTVQVSATDQDPGQTLTYSLVSAPMGAQINPTTGVFTWTPPVGVTSAQVIVEATDDGSPPMSGTAQFDVTVNPVLPVIAAIPAQSVNVGSTLTVQVTATDPGQTLTYSLVSAPMGAQINPTTGVFTWTPPVGVTSAQVIVEATVDGSPSVSGTAQFDVTVNPVPPVIAAIPAQSVNVGSTLTVQVTATDPGQTLVYSLAPGAPAGASINPTSGVFTWTPAVGSTMASVTILVSDNGKPPLTSSTAFNITVNDVPPKVTLNPEVVASRPQTVKVEGSFAEPGDESWSATVNYGDGSQTRRLPLNSNQTFLLSHDYKRRGVFTVTVTLTDSLGESGTANLKVEIGQKKPKPTVRTHHGRRL